MIQLLFLSVLVIQVNTNKNLLNRPLLYTNQNSQVKLYFTKDQVISRKNWRILIYTLLHTYTH